MARLEEILNRCSVEELRFAAHENRLSDKGTKGELVSTLASSVPPKKILGCISNKELQGILGKYQEPKSGTKDELVRRILLLVEVPKPDAAIAVKAAVRQVPSVEDKKAAYRKGRDFEKRVAAWAQKGLNATSVKTNTHVLGARVDRPYEVDVEVRFKGRGLLGKQHNLWIECKDRESSIKRRDVSDLAVKAGDVFEAYKVGRMRFYYFDRLAFASTSEFDSDALKYAGQTEVLCLYFDGKKFIERNSPDFDRDPSWLKRARGY